MLISTVPVTSLEHQALKDEGVVVVGALVRRSNVGRRHGCLRLRRVFEGCRMLG